MSIIIRNRHEAVTKDYFDHLYKFYGCIPENHQMAIDLRMKFFEKYVLNRRVNDYRTSEEKDWMYVARNEYFYDVQVRSAVDGLMGGLVACMARMAMLKKFIWWPFVPVALTVYSYRAKQLFVFHNKKFFDMCNIGEQYEVGFARNTVLARTNALLDRIDF